ncbi:MAG: Spy/CpxP family protein refolding chaperone [Elusimicrobiota bacterium]
MKPLMSAALAAALLTPGLWAVAARAQDDAPPPPPEQSEHQDAGKMADRMKEKLGLTDEQAGKLKDAMKTHGDAMKPIGQQMKDGFKKLGEQIKSKASDADIQASLDSLKTARKAMAEEQEKFHDALAAFLTPTQRAKMLIGAEMRMRREHGKGGPKGPRRGGDDKDGDDHGGPRGGYGGPDAPQDGGGQ